MGAFKHVPVPIKKAKLNVLAQTNAADKRFSRNGQLCCLCCALSKRLRSSASMTIWLGHLAIRFTNENQPHLVLEPADFIRSQGANVLAFATFAADHMYSHHAC